MYLVVTVFSVFYGLRIYIVIKYTLIIPHLITHNTLQKVENVFS